MDDQIHFMDNPFEGQKFKQLKKKWYKKLQEEGFEDVEQQSSYKEEMLKCWDSFWFDNKISQIGRTFFNSTFDYYYHATQFAQEIQSMPQVQQRIWQLHTDSISLREIALEINSPQTPINKDYVARIIKQIQQLYKIYKMEELKQLKKEDIIRFRTYNKSKDQTFIYDTWLKGLRYGNRWFGAIDHQAFFKTYYQVLETLFNRPNIGIKVACLVEDSDVIIGYCVFEGDAIHWVFVRPDWRGIGLSKDLIPAGIKTATHLTEVGFHIMPPDVKFNPFI